MLHVIGGKSMLRIPYRIAKANDGAKSQSDKGEGKVLGIQEEGEKIIEIQ